MNLQKADIPESPKTLGILVPKSQVLDDRAGPALQQLAENAAPAGIRLARLEGDAPLMARLKAGERIFVSADRWVNKSSGRMDVSLGTYVERPRTVGTFTHTTTEFEATEQFLSIGFTSWEEMVQRQFPWAKAVPDEFAEPDEDDLYDAYLAETGAWDSEDKVYIDVRGEFKQYRRAALRRWRSGIVEENDNGEIDTYRMELTLNALGRSFLRLRQYLQHGSTPVSPA